MYFLELFVAANMTVVNLGPVCLMWEEENWK